MNKINNSLFQIPQVILLTKGPNFKTTISFLIKKIICLDTIACQKSLCKNCGKFQNNIYFDLKWLKFNGSSFLKKQDSINIIEELLISSIEEKNPKICVIEQIEFSTLEASNVFLKFLENVNSNTYLIFTTNNIDGVLPTIKSRCQILDLAIKDNKIETIENSEELKLLLAISNVFNFDFYEVSSNDFEKILKLVNQFIINDNSNEVSNNFFLIKELNNLKQKSILFLKIIFLLIQNKLFTLNLNQDIDNNLIFKKLLKKWINNNNQFLTNVMETITLLENQFNNKINISLLLNQFFITIYKDINNER